MKKWFAILCIGFLPLKGFADIYRIIDSDGYVSFTDKPQKGAVKINLPPSQSYSSTTSDSKNLNNTLSSNTLSSSSPNNNPSASKSAFSYEKLQITSPADQASIQNTGGQVEIMVMISPKLRSGDKLVIALDDEPVAESAESNTSFVLQSVPRGTHHLQSYVMGSDTHILKSSDIITIYVHQQSKPNTTGANSQ